MKYLDEFRDPDLAKRLFDEIHTITTRHWALMEVCGGQTHSIIRNGIDKLLPDKIELIHGPGCPVCVTPLEVIDKALAIAAQPNVIFCSFGDMLRVPGSSKSLLEAKAMGGDVRIVYSPLQAVKLAQDNPEKEVVFFAVGFETTAPANALSVVHAQKMGVSNYSILASHVLVPPAMEAILSDPESKIDAFLAAGHVCTIMGLDEYFPIAEKYRVPIVVTGFEPVDLLQGILMAVTQLERGEAKVENQYARVVQLGGNKLAQETIHQVFDVSDRAWRGIGSIPASGYEVNEVYKHYNARTKFQLAMKDVPENSTCISGAIMKGLKKPFQCSNFGTKCKPEHPLGAPMVSSEGACAAYYAYANESNVSLQEA